MATKTITLEIDAYEKLRRAKKAPSESFSSVVRRAVFPNEAMTGLDLLKDMERRIREGGDLVDEATLDRLDSAQRSPRISSSEW
jgi:predicted CopG family antitoxin